MSFANQCYSLAYAEMTSILAKLMYHFEMSFADASMMTWGDVLQARMFWLKPPLPVKFQFADHLTQDEKALTRL